MCRNNALLSRVFLYAEVLFYSKVNSSQGQSGSTTLAINIEEAFKKKFYTTINSSHLNLHDHSLLLVKNAVDPRYRPNFYSPNLKQEI